MLAALGLPPHSFAPGKWALHATDSSRVCDRTSNHVYLKASPLDSCIKGALIAFGGIVLHAIALVVGVVYRLFACLSLYPLWQKGEKKWLEWRVDIARIALTTVALPELFFSAIYTCFSPQNGRKYHASAEILFYGAPFLALCFHSGKSANRLKNPSRVRTLQVMVINTLSTSVKMVIILFQRLCQLIRNPRAYKEILPKMLLQPLTLPLNFFLTLYTLINHTQAIHAFDFVAENLYEEIGLRGDIGFLARTTRMHGFSDSTHPEAF